MSSNVLNKLKFLPEEKSLILNAPESFLQELKGFAVDTESQQTYYDFVQLFVQSKQDVNRWVPVALEWLKEDGKLWCCYPKQKSGIKTDINRDSGWDNLYKAGYGAVAAISIDETWSALRFRPESKVDRKGAVVKSPAKKSAQERTLEIPQAVRQLLEKHPQEQVFFDSLAYTHRKEYVQWIIDAKREDTRERRLQQLLELLQEKKKSRY